MTLSESQRKFTFLIANLIQWVYNAGYELTFGEAWRTKEMAELYFQQGKGIKNSLHIDRLAVDLNLFKDGKYLQNSEDYKPLGDYWKSLDPDAKWGGDFKKPDGNHFSLGWQGRE